MPKKSFYLLPTFIIIILFSVLLLTGCNKNLDQVVYEDTISISKEYITLRYRTDNVLVNAKDYNDYKSWNKELSSIIKDWEKLEKEIIKLEKNAEKMSREKVSISLIENVYAYDKTEISNIFDKAPAGKKIMTLAKHLGVDVKKAHLILNQSQAEISSDIWKEEGDIYKKLEQDATRIKNGCKVAGFVGGVVLSGGTSAVAASGVLAKTALVVSGADLVLEITDDEAKIALGDKNKVSEIVGTIRIVTEPAASILTIVNMQGNLSKSIDKLGAASFTAEQIKSVIQDDKILGISIKPDDKGELKIEASSLTEAELPKWKKDNNIATSTQTIEEILNIKKIKEEKNTTTENKDSINENKDNSKKGIISFNEWDAWGDERSRYKEDLIEKFGNADITETKSGKQMWVYYDLVYYNNGTTCSPIYTFYDTDQVATRKCETLENVKSIINY